MYSYKKQKKEVMQADLDHLLSCTEVFYLGGHGQDVPLRHQGTSYKNPKVTAKLVVMMKNPSWLTIVELFYLKN